MEFYEEGCKGCSTRGLGGGYWCLILSIDARLFGFG